MVRVKLRLFRADKEQKEPDIPEAAPASQSHPAMCLRVWSFGGGKRRPEQWLGNHVRCRFVGLERRSVMGSAQGERGPSVFATVSIVPFRIKD